MGKKKKKSRRYDDDDLLLGPPSDQHELMPGDDGDVGATAVDPAPAAEDPSSPKETSSKKNPAKKKKKAVNIDLIRLEETMAEILKSYDGEYRSEDWLYRTIEKNMHLPKHSLRSSIEPDAFEGILDRVQQDVQQMLDQKYVEDMDKKKRWDDLVSEIREKSELTEEDEERLRAQARVMGVDPDAAVEAVVDAIHEKVDDTAEVGEDDSGYDQELEDVDSLTANAPLSVSILLKLQPYTLQPSSNHFFIVKFVFVLRRFICSLIYAMLSLLLGRRARTQANHIYDRIHLPEIKAAELAREREKDEQMLQKNTHLWSNQEESWIEKDATYLPPLEESSNEGVSIPRTVRWNAAKRQWERWSKNLKTRTKAMKQAEAAGKSTLFTKGTFAPVRIGEGWATAPDQPEVENEQVFIGGIRFFACLPGTGGEAPEVINVTTWATKTLLSKDAARELEAVDSGRDLFSMDVSTLMDDGKKGGKKGRGGKGSKAKRSDKGKDESEEWDVTGKGVGCTARISDRYSNRLEGSMA